MSEKAKNIITCWFCILLIIGFYTVYENYRIQKKDHDAVINKKPSEVFNLEQQIYKRDFRVLSIFNCYTVQDEKEKFNGVYAYLCIGDQDDRYAKNLIETESKINMKKYNRQEFMYFSSNFFKEFHVRNLTRAEKIEYKVLAQSFNTRPSAQNLKPFESKDIHSFLYEWNSQDHTNSGGGSSLIGAFRVDLSKLN